jgi:phosphatidylglycerol:prolipoprotein diacylglycerol transferase
MQPTAYAWLMVAGILVSFTLWMRLARRDERLVLIYIGGLIGAFIGAKLAFIFCEGWRDIGKPDFWLRFLTGKSILGALPGGYVGVELCKKLTHYKGITGDLFATVVPAGIVLGRLGCLFYGCCLGRRCDLGWFSLRDKEGVLRWPAVPVEIAFNVAMILLFGMARRRGLWKGQHFHIYLMAYGTFRFFHEFVRDTPRVGGWFSTYQLVALGVAIMGIVLFVRRGSASQRDVTPLRFVEDRPLAAHDGCNSPTHPS